MSKNASGSYLQKAIDACEKFNEEFDRPYFDNLGEANIESLNTSESPSKAYTMVEGQYGTKDVKPAVESMKKTANILIDQ